MVCWYPLPLGLRDCYPPPPPLALSSFSPVRPFSCFLPGLELHGSGFECRLSVAALGKAVHICDPYFLHL